MDSSPVLILLTLDLAIVVTLGRKLKITIDLVTTEIRGDDRVASPPIFK